MERALKTAIYDLAANERVLHAIALVAASITYKGDPGNFEGVLSLADEFADYIAGESGAKLPRPDLTGKAVTKK